VLLVDMLGLPPPQAAHIMTSRASVAKGASLLKRPPFRLNFAIASNASNPKMASHTPRGSGPAGGAKLPGPGPTMALPVVAILRLTEALLVPSSVTEAGVTVQVAP